MFEITIIKADGSIIKSAQDRKPDLDQLVEAVGGPIDLVPHFQKLEGHSGTGRCWANEEGKLRGLPFNAIATKAWLANLGKGPFRYDPRLCGDVIFESRRGRKL